MYDFYAHDIYNIGWTHMIYEDIVDVKLVQMSLTRGYHDFKYLIHGNKNSGPLNIKLDISKDSPVRRNY